MLWLDMPPPGIESTNAQPSVLSVVGCATSNASCANMSAVQGGGCRLPATGCLSHVRVNQLAGREKLTHSRSETGPETPQAKRVKFVLLTSKNFPKAILRMRSSTRLFRRASADLLQSQTFRHLDAAISFHRLGICALKLRSSFRRVASLRAPKKAPKLEFMSVTSGVLSSSPAQRDFLTKVWNL